MATITLEAQERDLAKKVSAYRAQKLLPAVFYASDKDNEHIVLDYETFRRAFRKGGMNTIIDLKLPTGKTEKVLVHDVQLDPIYDTYMHVDFYGVKMKEAITTTIPLHFVGESHAVKNLGGIFVVNADQVEVKCLPTDLVSHIEVDLTILTEHGSSIHLSNITLPKGMELVAEEDLTIATVQAPRVESEETQDVALDGSTAEEVEESTNE